MSSSSARRLAANRANAKKSQGPVTPEGKARSAANAPVRHGLSSPSPAPFTTGGLPPTFPGATVCLRNESQAAFAAHHESLVREHNPVTYTEHLTVQEMAVVRWRQQRAWAMEAALVDNGMDLMGRHLEETYVSTDEALRGALSFQELADRSPSLPTLLRYDARLTRQFDRCLLRLTNLRAQRQKVGLQAETNPINEHSTNAADDTSQLRHAGHSPVAAPPPAAAAPVQPGPASSPAPSSSQMDDFFRLTRPQAPDVASGNPSPLPRAA